MPCLIQNILPCLADLETKREFFAPTYVLTAERNRAYGSRMSSCLGCGTGVSVKTSSCFEGMPGPKGDMVTDGK